MENQIAVQNFLPVDPAAFAAAESVKARIQTAYLMAMQRPRNREAARLAILKECRRPDFARDVEFSKPVGGSKISGLSIRFAEVALREWKNVFIETTTVYEDEKIRRVKVIVLDLESNMSYSREIQISKTVERKNAKGRDVVSERLNANGDKVFIVLATDDELQTKEGALVSKAIRNEGLRMLPSDLKKEAARIAGQTITENRLDPDVELRDALEAFSGIGVTPEEIEGYLGHATTRITPAEHDDLRKIYRAISDGEATWESYQATGSAKAEKTEQKYTLPKKTEQAEPNAGLNPYGDDFPVICGNDTCDKYDSKLPDRCGQSKIHGADGRMSVKCSKIMRMSATAVLLDIRDSASGEALIGEAKAKLGIDKADTDETKWKLVEEITWGS